MPWSKYFHGNQWRMRKIKLDYFEGSPTNDMLLISDSHLIKNATSKIDEIIKIGKSSELENLIWSILFGVSFYDIDLVFRDSEQHFKF